MQLVSRTVAASRGWLKVNPDADQRSPREWLLDMATANGLTPVDFTSDGWAHSFKIDIAGDDWRIWRTATGFMTARLVHGDGGPRYTDHQPCASLRSAILRVNGVLQPVASSVRVH